MAVSGMLQDLLRMKDCQKYGVVKQDEIRAMEFLDRMLFADRQDAGRKLASALQKFASRADVVVYGLPRGGVIPAAEVAAALRVPLELIIARKIAYPGLPEYAIGAIAEDGEPIFSQEAQALSRVWLKAAVRDQRNEIRRRRKKYVGDRVPFSGQGKTALIVDDGVATGLTLLAAIKYLRRAVKPKTIVAAVPVASTEALSLLRDAADEVIVLYEEQDFFGAVGRYYQAFPQVEDEEVIRRMNP